ncbi:MULTISPECIES: hypothetical protein [unclassified Xanthobacter]|uniref:hypothetical protein n=1 Tax=unclassified Xanthobacter TaxID=2623496 RepID=UPI001EDE28BF|nr:MULTISPECIES: hypothetical protein [unclassified Xanthobacter]
MASYSSSARGVFSGDRADPARRPAASPPWRGIAAGMGLCVAAATVASSGAARAQYLTYERPFIYERPYVYEEPPPIRSYSMLPPGEVRRLVRNLGYWDVSVPRLAGRIYVLRATDEEGPVSLRVDAFTGRVVTVDSAAPRPAPPAYGALPRPASPPPVVPLPPRRPAEADLALTSPAAPAPAIAAPAAPPSAAPAASASASREPAASAALQPAPSAPAPSAPAPSASAPSASARVAPAPSAAPVAAGASPAPVTPVPAVAPALPAAGTATPGSEAAGSASVLSRGTGN